MIRLVAVVVATIIVVAFFLMNLHFVTISLVVGPPAQVRLILLLLLAFGAGALCTLAFSFIQKSRVRHRSRQAVASRDDEMLAK